MPSASLGLREKRWGIGPARGPRSQLLSGKPQKGSTFGNWACQGPKEPIALWQAPKRVYFWMCRGAWGRHRIDGSRFGVILYLTTSYGGLGARRPELWPHALLGRLYPPLSVGLRRRLPTRPGRAGSGTMSMANRALASLGFRVSLIVVCWCPILPGGLIICL